MKSFGDRLKKLRLDLELSQGEVAKAIGVSQRAISSLENIPDRAPSSENLRALASFFQVEQEWLLTGKGSQTPISTLTAQEKELLQVFRSLSSTAQTYVLGRAHDVYRDEFSETRGKPDGRPKSSVNDDGKDPNRLN